MYIGNILIVSRHTGLGMIMSDNYPSQTNLPSFLFSSYCGGENEIQHLAKRDCFTRYYNKSVAQIKIKFRKKQKELGYKSGYRTRLPC